MPPFLFYPFWQFLVVIVAITFKGKHHFLGIVLIRSGSAGFLSILVGVIIIICLQIVGSKFGICCLVTTVGHLSDGIPVVANQGSGIAICLLQF